MDASKNYYGKYRGVVVNNVDPLRIGRIMAKVPDITDEMPWALPCFPIGGINMGFFSIPPIGSNVWIEFEKGDINLSYLDWLLLGNSGGDAVIGQKYPSFDLKLNPSDNPPKWHHHKRHARDRRRRSSNKH